TAFSAVLKRVYASDPSIISGWDFMVLTYLFIVDRDVFMAPRLAERSKDNLKGGAPQLPFRTRLRRPMAECNHIRSLQGWVALVIAKCDYRDLCVHGWLTLL